MSVSFRALAIAASLLGAAAPALADPLSANPGVINDQLQWGDVFATMDVVTTERVETTLSASSLAAGNSTLAANAVGEIDMRNAQAMEGLATARTTVQADDVCCAVSAGSTAHGNAAEARSSTWTRLESGQWTQAGDDVSATTQVQLRNTTQLQAGSVASANTVSATGSAGHMTTRITQDSGSNVRAVTDTDACCTNMTSTGAVATGNSYSSDSSGGNALAEVTQTQRGGVVQASTDTFQVYAGDVAAASTAAGNSTSVTNRWGWAQLNASQTNDSYVRAETGVTLNEWAGTATATSYGVGNAALLSNTGASARGDVVQVNNSGVDSYASFTGGTGGVASGYAGVSSTAIGNAYTGFVCAVCGGGASTGYVSQTNNASVNAVGTINATGAWGVSGSAAAIGNSSSFIVSQPGG